MAAKDGRRWWDPYETSHKKQFIYLPNSAAEILVRPMSTSFIDSYSKSGPCGSTVYNKEFCWKPACRPESIRTGTSSGQRRNNPHPSQSFMMWRLPRDAARSSEYASLPWRCPRSEAEIRKALTAQYSSTYTCDFMGLPQGCDDINKTEGRLAPLHAGRHIPKSADTEMRDRYRRPKQKPELLDGPALHSCNRKLRVTCRGIVPTVVQRHVTTQQKGCDLTTYHRFFGKKVSDVTSVMRSLPPQELQQLLPDAERAAVQSAESTEEEKGNKLPAVVRTSCSPERLSSWSGPV